jgi:hypothetical protein
MWSFDQVELEARKLLAAIEKNSARLWPNTPPARLFMCDPEAACRLLGLRYLPDSHLGSYGGTATAGMLDCENRAVLLSSKQSFESQRFTAAHEVGHWLLHPGQTMFRDRSLSSHGGQGRPRVEQEADCFAACFLAPPKLVCKAFRARFPVREPITNTGVICYNLSMRNGQYLEGLPAGSFEFALAVARADAFNGLRFKPLYSLFNVSPSAMAIRLQELELVH